ncbi:MAG TPA: hypothetical protein VKD66_16300 [Streptosporangiaceae bacterium]|nr:hypothetical protein [Streptosporangiaceae bacterium]
MAKQNPLFDEPTDFRAWFRGWTEAHPTETADPFDWRVVRNLVRRDLPFRLVPPMARLVDTWLVKEFNAACAELGMRRTGVRPASARPQARAEAPSARGPATDGDEEAEEEAPRGPWGFRWIQAKFEDWFAWEVGNARKAAADVEAIDVRVEEYAAAHPELALDPEVVKASIREAAGL